LENPSIFVQKRIFSFNSKTISEIFLNFADFYKNISVAKNFFRNFFQILGFEKNLCIKMQ